jgi:putative tryptophan/tyrosine transport system substrate-binding protein
MLSGFAEDRLVESELLRTLSQLGWDNGRNVQIDLRWGAGNIDRIKMMAKELVASQPEIIITVGTPATVVGTERNPHDPDHLPHCSRSGRGGDC